MLLAHFPVEILSILTEHILLTDLVLLHACGDSDLNAKLKRTPTTIRVLSTRCGKYYTEKIVARFGPVIGIDHLGKKGFQKLAFIPETVKFISTNCSIESRVPMSVESITCDYIGGSARFSRKPTELKVSVENAYRNRVDALDHPEYITHLRDYRNYGVEMINLTSMSMPADCQRDPIPGVSFEYRAVKCHHWPKDDLRMTPENIWISQTCDKCHEIVSILVRGGTECEEMPPCESVEFECLNIGAAKLALIKMANAVKTITISAPLSTMNEFCDGGLLDLIPSSVALLNLIITKPDTKPSPSFSGLSKRYPFLVILNSYTYAQIEVKDFTGIDDCSIHMVRNPKIRRKIEQTYKRLSFFGFIF